LKLGYLNSMYLNINKFYMGRDQICTTLTKITLMLLYLQW